MNIPYRMYEYLQVLGGGIYLSKEELLPKIKELRGQIAQKSGMDEESITSFDIANIVHRKRVSILKDNHDLKMEYHSWACLLHELGQPFLEDLSKCNYYELMGILKSSDNNMDTLIEINGCGTNDDGTTCKVCKRDEGRILTIREALDTMPLPHSGCEHRLNRRAVDGWCTCWYAHHHTIEKITEEESAENRKKLEELGIRITVTSERESDEGKNETTPTSMINSSYRPPKKSFMEKLKSIFWRSR